MTANPATTYYFSISNISAMPNRFSKNKFLRLIISLGVCLLVGYLGSLYAIPMIPSWFSSLEKPPFLPPDQFLVPIGALMYVLLGLAMYSIWQADLSKKDTMLCFVLFVFGLCLNVLWVYMLFGLRSPFMALVIMIMLLGILVTTLYQSLRVTVAAALFLTPYLIVSIIAAYANFLIYIMNPKLPLIVL
jgi:tryptophan-rich sensory protein